MEYGTYDFSAPGLDYSLINNNNLLFFYNVKFPSQSSGNFNSLLGTPTLLPSVLHNSPMLSESNVVLCFSEEYNAPNLTLESGCRSGASALASVSKQEILFASKKKKKTREGSQNTNKLSVDPQSVAACHRRHRKFATTPLCYPWLGELKFKQQNKPGVLVQCTWVASSRWGPHPLFLRGDNLSAEFQGCQLRSDLRGKIRQWMRTRGRGCMEKSGSECGVEEGGGGSRVAWWRVEGLPAAEAGQFSGRWQKPGNSSTQVDYFVNIVVIWTLQRFALVTQNAQDAILLLVWFFDIVWKCAMGKIFRRCVKIRIGCVLIVQRRVE